MFKKTALAISLPILSLFSSASGNIIDSYKEQAKPTFQSGIIYTQDLQINGNPADKLVSIGIRNQNGKIASYLENSTQHPNAASGLAYKADNFGNGITTNWNAEAYVDWNNDGIFQENEFTNQVFFSKPFEYSENTTNLETINIIPEPTSLAALALGAAYISKKRK